MAKTPANIGLATSGGGAVANYLVPSTQYFIGEAILQAVNSSNGSVVLSITGPSVVAGACAYTMSFTSPLTSDAKKPIVAGPGDTIHIAGSGVGGTIWLTGFLYDTATG